jgi:hypothetical protein
VIETLEKRMLLDNAEWITLDEGSSSMPPENMPEAGEINVNLQFGSETPYLNYNVHMTDGIGGSTDSGDLTGAITTAYDDDGTYTISAGVDEDQGWAMQRIWDSSWDVNVYNVQPGATLNSELLEDHETVHLTLSSPFDVSSADTAAGLKITFSPTYAGLAQTYAIADAWPAEGDPSAEFDTDSSPSGTWYARIYDKDGGYSDYASTYVLPSVNTPVISDTSVQLSWLDVADEETGWYVQRALYGGSFSTVATLDPNSTSFLDTGLTPGTRYQWRVRAFGTPGTAEDTAWSAKQAATTLTPASDLQVSGTDDGDVQLNWDGDDDNTDAYEIEASTNGTSFSYLTETTDQQIVLDAPTAGAPVYYRVVARRSAFRAPATSTVSVVSINGTPGSDDIEVIQDLDHSNGSYADFTVGTSAPIQVSLSSTDLVIIDGGGNADHIIISYANGNPIPDGGVQIVGGGLDDVTVNFTDLDDSASICENVATVSGKHFSWMGVKALTVNFKGGDDTFTCHNIDQLAFDEANHSPASLSANGGAGDDVITIDGASNVQIGVDGDDKFVPVGNDQITVGDISANYGGGVEIAGGLGDDLITVHDMLSLDVIIDGDLPAVHNDTINSLGGMDTLHVQVDEDDTIDNADLGGGHGTITFDVGDPRVDGDGERTDAGPNDVLIVDMAEMPDSVSGQMSIGYQKDGVGSGTLFSHVDVKVESGGTERCQIVCDPLYEEGWQFIGGDGDDRIDLGARPPDVDTNQDWLKNASISAGDGDDVIGVGTDLDADDTIGGNNIDGFVGLKFDGGDGSDEVRFYDQDNPSTSSRDYVASDTNFQLPSLTLTWSTDVSNIETIGAYMAPKKTSGIPNFDVHNMPSDIQLFIAGGTSAEIVVYGAPQPVLLRPGVGAYNVDVQASSAAIDYDHDHTPPYEWYNSRLMLNDVKIRVGATLGVANGVGTRDLAEIANLTMYRDNLTSYATLDVNQIGIKIASFTGILLDHDTGEPIGDPVAGLTGLQPFVDAGYNSGSWNGSAGIRSDVPSSDSDATGIFVLTGADYHGHFPSVWTMDGASFADTDILIRCTWKGDATLDGIVDLVDLYQLNDHYNQTVIGSDLLKWFQCDFNLSGNVNLADLTVLNAHWQWGQLL